MAIDDDDYSMKRADLQEFITRLTYVGGENSLDGDIYDFLDKSNIYWEIEVDCHNDDGDELTNDEIIEHAIRIRMHGFDWADVTDD